MLCDAFRYPTVLAKHAIILPAAFDGKFNFSLGSWLWSAEFARFDIIQ